MPDIEIKRGYEVLPDNNVRFGIRVINNSDSAISDVEVILDYSESLFELEGNKIQKLGTIPPTVPRTAKFILKPLGCVHKEEIGATVLYKDHQWKKHTVEMRPKEVHCVCPFLKEKSITRADFLRLSNSGSLEERGVNFDGITVDKLVDFIGHTCKNRLYKVDEFPIENGKILYLAGDALGEKAYYLLTVVVKEYEGLTQVLLRASSDKSHGLNGFLNEILDNLRHLVLSASAREIGIIRKEQVINIIDSVVTRPTFEMGEGTPSVDIKGSVVTRPVIKADEEKKKREGEKLRKEKEEQERLRRQKEQEERALRERKAREDAERRESERLKARQEEERIEKEREKLSVSEKKAGISQIKFLAVALMLGVLLVGYWAMAPGASDAPEKTISTPTSNIKITTSPTQSPITAQPSKYWTASAQRLNVVTEAFNNNVSAAVASGLEGTGQRQGFENGYYYVLYWQGDKLVAINGKMGKFAKLLIEQGLNSSDKKFLAEGETWDIGDGWALTAQSIDARASPRQARLVLTKGTTKKTYVVTTGQIITYVEKSSFGESDVPLFVTYVDSIFAGATIDAVQFRYTWAISYSTMTQIKKGDVYGDLEVVTIDNINKRIELTNISTNSIGMEFVFIPAGEFDMGSPANEKDRDGDEGPVHRVKITKDFYMGKYEVTQKQWREIMGNNPSNFKGDNLPVESVSWNDVQEFVRKINEKEGTNKYRLPSEAEWEYAARAGTTTRYSFGDDESKLDEYAWDAGNSGDKIHEVGQKKPNPWGLYDMHGNVWEWVQDIYHSSYNGAPTDGSAWESGVDSDRVFRGGNRAFIARALRSAARQDSDPGTRDGYGPLGFRLLRIL